MSKETKDTKSNKEKVTTKHLKAIRKSVKNILTATKFQHSLAVEKKALEIIERHNFNINPVDVSKAALLHDVTKQLRRKIEHFDLIRTYCDQTNTSIDDLLSEIQIGLDRYDYHALSGMAVAYTQYRIKNPEILNAIRFHSYADYRMNLLARVIFVADWIENTRNFPELKDLQKSVDKDFEFGFIDCLEMTIQESLKKSLPILECTNRARTYFLRLYLNT